MSLKEKLNPYFDQLDQLFYGKVMHNKSAFLSDQGEYFSQNDVRLIAPKGEGKIRLGDYNQSFFKNEPISEKEVLELRKSIDVSKKQ